MKKTMKKIFALLMTLAIALSLMPAAASAANESSASMFIDSGSCGAGVSWGLTKGGMMFFDGSGDMYDYEEKDIDRTSGMKRPVQPWSAYCEKIKTVVIGDGITRIGKNAFCGCKNIASVWIPNSVTYIGSSAFSSCENLPRIFIPDSVAYIGDSAFAGCRSLEDAALPDSLTSIEPWVFDRCESLKRITIPYGVTAIGADAFSDCRGLKSVTIPDSVTTIGTEAFWCCESLEDITIPASVTSIADSAFYSCGSLTDIYYEGTQEKWNNISSFLSNTGFANPEIHFFGISEVYPPVPIQKEKTAPDSLRIVPGEQPQALPETENSVYIANAVDESGTKTLTYFDYNQREYKNYTYEYSYRVPKIVSGSEDARWINDNIFAEYEEQLKPREGPIAAIYLGTVDWDCTEIDGLFLLRVNYHPYEIAGVADELAFSRVYYFNSSTGRWLNAQEMLGCLGFNTADVIAAAQKQLDHDFNYYWMQISYDESESARRDARENTGTPHMTAELSDLWYDGECFVYSWHIDNGSAHGAVVQVRFDPKGRVLLHPGEAGYTESSGESRGNSYGEESVSAGIGYPPRPVNYPLEYSMLNGSYENVTVRKKSFYTDEKGSLHMSFTVNEVLIQPGGGSVRYPAADFSCEIAWNAVVEDFCGPWMDQEYDVYYTYDDPREFFDYYPELSEAAMYLKIEGGLATYMSFLSPEA